MTILELQSLLDNLGNHPDTTPEPPPGWSPLSEKSPPPMPGEIQSAEDAAHDLAELDGYVETFGASAPDRDALVTTLLAAHEASGARRRAAKWLAYLADQEARAWKSAMPLVVRLRHAWEPVAALDGSLEANVPGLAALMTTRSSMAKRAARTRLRAEKAQKKALKEAGMQKPST